MKNTIWNSIWKKNKYHTSLHPTNNVTSFYNFHLTKLKKNSKVLDCGCGNGRNFMYLAEKGFDVYGTDISTDIIKKNKIKFKKYKNKFFSGDIRSLDFNEKYFDVIISEGSLYYQDIKNIKLTINKFYHLLKTNGILRVYTKSINDNFFHTFDKTKSKEYKVQAKHWAKGLVLSFLTVKDIKIIFKKFKKLKIGIEEFNFINYKKKRSFYVITVKK